MRRYASASWIHPALFTAPSAIDGVGLFTNQTLAAGEVVVVWGGTTFTRAEVANGAARAHTVVAIDDGVFIGTDKDAPLTADDYMNHSCRPNVRMEDEVTLTAREEILAGSELVADYAMWLDDPNYVMKRDCNCGSSECRRRITGHDWKLASVQASNRGCFSPFIRRRIATMNFSGDQALQVLVTGGSRGIGFAVATELAAAGHRVAIVARNPDTLSRSAAELTRVARSRPLAFSADISSADGREQFVAYCQENQFEPDVLVLNAGIFIEGSLVESEPADLFATLDVNLHACFHLVQAFVPSMRAKQRGRVILMGSTAAYEPYPVGPLYGVSKWALRGLAANLRKELMLDRVGVTFLAPGGTLTDLWAGESIADDRLLRPSDIARLVRALLELSPQAVVEELIVRPMLGDMHD